MLDLHKDINPGHLYELENFEDKSKPGQRLQFIEKLPVSPGSPTLYTVSDGTTNEEVLAVLIDRVSILNAKFPCKENACCITHLQEALHWLESRTRARLKRGVEGQAKA